MNERIYTTIKLSNGDSVTVVEVNGGHMLATALALGPEASANIMVFVYHLVALCSMINGQSVGIDYIKTLSFIDLDNLCAVVGSQMQNVNKL